MAVPGHLEKTFLREAMGSGEAVVGCNELLFEEDEAVEVFSFASAAVVRAIRWSPAEFLGQAKRLSGRMCAKLHTTEKEKTI